MKPFFWDSTDPATGLPYTYDSPNLTWDGILEPGDPGYTPVPPPAVQPKPKPKKMKHNTYYPTNVPEQSIWLINFFNKLLGYAATLGLSPAETAAIVADARWLVYILGSWQPAQRAWAKACTDAVREAQTGGSGALMVLPVFVPPALPAAEVGGLPAVVPTNTGALSRIFAAVKVLRESTGYLESIGTDLGVIGTEMTLPDLATIRPAFTVRIIGGHVFIDWSWGGNSEFLDQIQLQVDRGAGYVDLTFDTTPGYTDTAPFPAALATWKYRGIFRVDDAQVGVWSNAMSITVGG